VVLDDADDVNADERDRRGRGVAALLDASGVGRLRKRGRPVSSFCIQLTNAVHDQTWKSQSFGFGGPGMLPPGKTGARSVDSHQPGKTLQALAVPAG
jgi:hypothetical protein